MSAYPAESGLELGATALMFPNKFFDPVAGILGVWGNDGTVTHEDAKTCIRPLGQELFPEVLKMAKELDLKSPFETNQPVSIDYMNGSREPARAAAE